MAEMDNKTLLAVFGLFVGVYGWLLKHLSNSKKHPCNDNLVYKDVCEANRDCIETKIDGLQKLVEQRFDNLEDLIKNNGHSTPRIRT